MSIVQRLLQRLLPPLLARRCEEALVPRSGERGARVNCFAIYATTSEGSDIMLDSLHGDEVRARAWDGQSFTPPVTLTLSQIDPKTLLVTHFWGLTELRFRGVWQVTFARWTGLPYLRARLGRGREAIAQHLFNRRTLASRRRIELLEELTSAALEGQNPLSATGLLTHRYGGYRWARHPSHREHLRELELQLAMLADTGELQRQQGGEYRVTGHALRALEEAREEDRRHRANFVLQVVLALLAAATAFTGLVQANVVKLPTFWDARGEAEKAKEKNAEPTPLEPATPARPAPR